ncbi:hypothetical protein, partial [Helicobacter typhlonius]|uniref:hypothetical protein n=1 Tax=Helicobacter typhlonius TaxID=76936 RepID=UPI002FE3C81A
SSDLAPVTAPCPARECHRISSILSPYLEFSVKILMNFCLYSYHFETILIKTFESKGKFYTFLQKVAHCKKFCLKSLIFWRRLLVFGSK